MIDARLTEEQIREMTPADLRKLARVLKEEQIRKLVLAMADIREKEGQQS